MTVTSFQSRTLNGVETISLFVFSCADCGIVFGIPNAYDDARRRDGKGFSCPNGHTLSYSDTAEKRLAREKAALEKRTQQLEEDRSWYQQQLRAEREDHKTTKRQKAAVKGQLTKTKKRAAATLCPVDGCHRSFVQMRRHLETKHPDFVAEQPVTQP